MGQKTERDIKKSTTNFFGSLGYLFCFLQLFWVIMLYFSVIQSMAPLFVPSHTDTPVHHSLGLTLTFPGPLEMIILGSVTVVMIILTIYVLIKIPMSIVKTSNKIVHNTAETMTPIILKAQHKKNTKKIHAKITARLTLAIKSFLIIVSIGLTATSGLLEKQSIDYSIALVIGCGLACFSIGFFAIQYLSARLLHVKMPDLW